MAIEPAQIKHSKSILNILPRIFSFFLAFGFIIGILFMVLSFPFDMFKQLLPSDIAIFIFTLFCGVKLYANSEKGEGYITGYNDAIDQMQQEA